MIEQEKHVVVCGHVKHGKSTFTGRLLVETGAIGPAEVDRIWQEAQLQPAYLERPKDYNKYQAITLRHRGATFNSPGVLNDQSRTVFPARGRILTNRGPFTLIDNPGHHTYIDNIVYGIYLADSAIIVVGANDGVAEGTERVARILEGLKVPVLGVCITKMDMVNYSPARFDEVRAQIVELLEHRNLTTNDGPPVIPTSSLEGAGFGFAQCKGDEVLRSWYKGPSVADLLEIADDHEARLAHGQLRIVVGGPSEVRSPEGVGTVVIGSLESGTVTPGDELVIVPVPEQEPRTLRVKSVRRARTVSEGRTEDTDSVGARAIVSLAIKGVQASDLKRSMRHGAVLGRPSDPPQTAYAATCNLVFFENETVYSDKEFQLHCHGSRVPCRIVNLMDDRSGLDNNAEYVGEFVHASINFEKAFSMERAEDFPRLARFVLREKYKIVACGVCVDLYQTPAERRLFRRDDAPITAVSG
ncbi:MAG TPA: GTP-binding protein [Thermoanaerobaculia bacterium]|jgi:elongation factor 1-alpha|nr:GTP-binding protein [Thermoanaerobaculia bacterium]